MTPLRKKKLITKVIIPMLVISILISGFNGLVVIAITTAALYKLRGKI